MGYGAGRTLKLNTKDWMHIIYNGRNFVTKDFVDNIWSWNLEHPADRVCSLRPEILTYSVKIEPLTQDDRDYLKKDGWSKGEQITAELEGNIEGDFWSGWCSSPLRETFPLTLEGKIYLSGFGNKKIFVTVTPKDWADFQNLFDDIGEHPAEDEINDFMEEQNLSREEALEEMYQLQYDIFEANWQIS